MSEKTKQLIGTKGGGSQPPPPISTPDNLRSKDTVELVLALGEGPMWRLHDGDKSFFIGDTKLQNESGEYNFRYFQLKFFEGSDNPDPVVLTLGGVSQSHNVSLALSSNVPVVRQTTNGQIDFIEIRLVVNRLLTQNDRGTFNHTLSFRIEYKPLSANSWTKFYGDDIKVSGKTTSAYVKEIRQAVPRINEPYEIRVTKLSSDSDTKNFTDVTWESYQEVISDHPTYENTCLVHLVGESSDQFSSIPQFSGIYDGLIVRVPSNYNSINKTYNGIWDGSFISAWTNNPAWILYDFVMNDRYGIKSYYSDINLDKYDVYEAAKWCDELVPDGQGGTQPRYTFNAVIQEPRSGKEMAKYIAGTFNATFFDDLNGKAYLRVDKEEDAIHLFTPENVYEEGFEYSYVDIASRYNDITVTFINPDLDWVVDRRRVFNQEYIDKNGRIPLDFVAVGCTNVHEAVRRAQYKLITANTETCMVNFSTNRLGQFVNVFDTILIADEDMGYSLTGRIKELLPSGSSVTLRDPIYLEVGTSYNLELVMKNGDLLKTQLLSGHPTGLVSQLNFTTTIDPNDLPQNTVFSLQNSTTVGNPRPFKVLSVEEIDGQSDKYNIQAININRNKWYDSDNVTDSGTIQYAVLPSPFDPPGPTSVTFEERYVKKLKQYHIIVNPVFDRSKYKYYSNDHSFEVWSRLTGTNDAFVKRTLEFGDTLIDHPPGQYDFKVLGRSYLGGTTRLETSATYTFDVTNPAEPPIDVDWIKINEKEVFWGYENPPDDFAGFQVRYHNQVGRTTWDDAARPHEGLLAHTSFYTNLIPASARVILVKAIDDFGHSSVNAAYIFRSAGAVFHKNVVDQTDYHTTFTGTKENCAVVSGELLADAPGTLMYSDTPTTPMYNGGNFYSSTYDTMRYYPTLTITKEGELSIDIDSDDNGYQIDIREVGETAWVQVSSNMYIQAGNYELRVTLFAGGNRGRIRTLSAIVDVEDVEEVLEDVIIPAAATRLTLTKQYSTIKTVSVIIQNDGSSTAVSYRLNDKDTVLGPEIELLDASGAITSGLIDAVIKGY